MPTRQADGVTSSPSPARVALARDAFSGGRGYLAACTMGLPTRAGAAAVRADLDRAESGGACAVAYGATAERCRAHYAGLVGVEPDRVALAAQTSVAVGMLAAALPDGARVVVPEGDFSSLVLPFVHAGRGIRVVATPLADLAAAIDDETAAVAFSLVQSATGEVADAEAVIGAAARHGAVTLCDTTQAVGWLPVDATRFDATVCHAYKWLCCPRGVGFVTLGARLQQTLRPVHAGWYAGDDPWGSCYGGAVDLARSARRFDVSPAWQAFVGAEPALALFASLDSAAVRAHAVGLAGAFRDRLGLSASDSAIVTWPDADSADLHRLSAAGLVASGRAGRVRVAFHVFNDAGDVDLAATALAR